MADYVLDASVALAWFLSGQSTLRTDALLNRANMLTFSAPSHLGPEFRNGLLRAERRGLLDVADSDAALVAFSSLGIRFHEHADEPPLQAAWRLARMHRLGLYDALYLDLAARSGDVLASRDGALLAAANAMGLATYDARMN